KACLMVSLPGSERWQFDNMQVRADDRDRTLVVKHTWPHEGEHIALHDPSRVLRQSEAFRQLIAWQSRAAEDEDREPGMYPPLESETLSVVLGILASIYPEDTTETKGEQ
ncbi:MAG TPA: DUF6221 family protein, partial [Pseudonocardia sp.]